MRLEYAAGERMSVDSQLLDVAPDIFNNHRIDLQAMLESQTQNDITDITGPQWPPPTEGGCRRGPTGPTLDSASCPEGTTPRKGGGEPGRTHVHAIVTTLLHTRLRVDELVRLTWADVTLQPRSGSVRPGRRNKPPGDLERA